MKPVPIRHNEYRASLRNGIHQYYPETSKISKDTWTVYNQFKKLDLSRVDTFMQDKYSFSDRLPDRRLLCFAPCCWL